jgi:hypothetical protein
MNCLIVDAFSEGRTAVLAEYLRSNGHAIVMHAAQLEAPPGPHLLCPAWVKLIHKQDAVFLHVGDRQKNTCSFLNALGSLPVFCYTGSEAPAEIVGGCGAPGPHVLYPEGIGGSEASGHRLVAGASLWLRHIVGRVGPERFAEAWHSLRNLDMEKEESLEELEKRLGRTLRESHWTPEQAPHDQLRGQLKIVKDQRIEWGI